LDGETTFMSREPGEFTIGEEKERQLLADWKADPDYFFNLAEVGGEIVGTCHASVPNTRARYRHRVSLAIGIRKDHWGLGIGRRLMEAAIAWARTKEGVTQVELGVDTTNERAIALYRAVGMEIVGTLPRDRRMKDGRYRSEHHMAIYFD
jgi:RimJ/RimL family protein N-acetyltransferase